MTALNNSSSSESASSGAHRYLLAGLALTPAAAALHNLDAAERIVYAEKWQVQAELAATRLAGTRSVRWTSLFPGCGVLLVVATDGQVIGRVRHQDHRWHAVAVDDESRRAGTVAIRRSRRAAIAALAQHADHHSTRRRLLRPLCWWSAVSTR